MSPRKKKLTAHIVSHTHWDRAWYWTFEQTRVRLLDLMDDLLALMQRDPGYRHFVLDGQMAMVQDYLALRPQQASSVRRLAREGRLLLGPFYVLPDLFIPSGESLVRNLRAGHADAAALGPVMKLGYLPDPFGHPAQLPQILAGFGIRHMLFSRGLGDEADQLDADFYWDAPDGSRILATHQVGGYGNLERFGHPPTASARDESPLPPFEEQLARALRAVEQRVEQMAPCCPSGHLLLNNGCDHLPAQPELPELIRAINRGDPALGIRLVHSTPQAYERGVRRAIRQGRFRPRLHQGELRGGRFNNLLPGVLSARMDLKLAHDRCERLLLRWAEPWSALASSLGPGQDDRALLDHAWRLLLLCQPHDDICGCSIDRVHDDDLNRMSRVLEVAGAVRDRAMTAIASAVPRTSALAWMAFNPNPWPVEGVVELPGGQRTPGLAVPTQRSRGSRLAWLKLPPLGFTRVDAGRARAPSSELPVEAVTLRRTHRKAVIDNGLIRLEALEQSGQLRLRDLRSGLVFRVAQLLDEGDAGDTYDYSPPARQRAVRGPLRFRRVVVREAGPLRARLELAASLVLPVGLTRDRRNRSGRVRRLPLRLELLLCAGSPRLELRLTLTNTVRDHRLRFTLQAPFATDQLVAGAPFQVIRRPLVAEDRPRWHQPPLPFQPFMDFVALERSGGGGIALLAPGLREVEGAARHGRTQIGVTLLRSVGWLSRDDLATRTGEAGPCFPVAGALHLDQGLTFQLGLIPFAGGWVNGDVARHHAELAAPPVALPLTGARGGQLPPSMALLQVEPATVQLVALAPRAEHALEARLVNLEPRTVEARLVGPYRGRRLGLDGQPRPGPVDLGHLVLAPAEILTLELVRFP